MPNLVTYGQLHNLLQSPTMLLMMTNMIKLTVSFFWMDLDHSFIWTNNVGNIVIRSSLMLTFNKLD